MVVPSRFANLCHVRINSLWLSCSEMLYTDDSLLTVGRFPSYRAAAITSGHVFWGREHVRGAPSCCVYCALLFFLFALHFRTQHGTAHFRFILAFVPFHSPATSGSKNKNKGKLFAHSTNTEISPCGDLLHARAAIFLEPFWGGRPVEVLK